MVSGMLQKLPQLKKLKVFLLPFENPPLSLFGQRVPLWIVIPSSSPFFGWLLSNFDSQLSPTH